METATEQTTGGTIWEAARVLLSYFEVRPELLASKPSVLELGSGTGFLGMSLARDVETRRIVLTEMVQGGALTWLERNVRRNLDAGCRWKRSRRPRLIGRGWMRIMQMQRHQPQWRRRATMRLTA